MLILLAASIDDPTHYVVIMACLHRHLYAVRHKDYVILFFANDGEDAVTPSP